MSFDLGISEALAPITRARDDDFIAEDTKKVLASKAKTALVVFRYVFDFACVYINSLTCIAGGLSGLINPKAMVEINRRIDSAVNDFWNMRRSPSKLIVGVVGMPLFMAVRSFQLGGMAGRVLNRSIVG